VHIEPDIFNAGHKRVLLSGEVLETHSNRTPKGRPFIMCSPCQNQLGDKLVNQDPV